MKESKVYYRIKDDCVYQICPNRKQIICIKKNKKVSYPDYDSHVDLIMSYKSISLNSWQSAKNNFFISRQFEWVYNGKRFRTTDKPFDWVEDKYGSRNCLVFHNGQIWKASNSANYYPRIQLNQIEPEFYTLDMIVSGWLPKSKWTDIIYCRNFEEY